MKPQDGELRFAGFPHKGFPHVTNRDVFQYEDSPRKWTAITGPFTGKHYDESELADFSAPITDPGP